MSFGHGFENSLFEFASLLGGVGFSVGIISPTAPDLILWTGMAGMFIGRLEFTVIVVALMKLF
jgi:trk system potassium uptake protein TrkH